MSLGDRKREKRRRKALEDAKAFIGNYDNYRKKGGRWITIFQRIRVVK